MSNQLKQILNGFGMKINYNGYYPYRTKAVKASFIVPDSEIMAFKNRMRIDGATILEEHTPETRSKNSGTNVTSWGIVAGNVSFLLLKKYNAFDCTLQYTDNIRVRLWGKQDKEIEHGTISFRQEPTDKWKDDCITIRSVEKTFMDGSIDHYSVSWSSIGSVSTSDAIEFAVGLKLAGQIAKELESNLER